MRKANAESLIKKAEDQFVTIRTTYEQSLQKHQIDAGLKVEIKNLCENLRSALDYLAHDIREKYCPTSNPKDRFYFPILPNAASFNGTAGSWFSGLDISAPQIWSFLESIQPYQTGFAWIGSFNKLNNENKHGDLVEQIRKETHRINVDIQNGGTVSWNPAGVRFGPGVSIGGVPVNPATQMPVPHPSQTVERIIWVDFRFKEIDVSAIELLSKSVTGVKAIVTQAYSII